MNPATITFILIPTVTSIMLCFNMNFSPVGYELFPDCTDIPPLSDNGLVEKSEDSTDRYYFGAGDYGDYECTLISHTKDDNGTVDAVFSLATHEGEYARATVHLVQNENNDAASGRFYYRVRGTASCFRFCLRSTSRAAHAQSRLSPRPVTKAKRQSLPHKCGGLPLAFVTVLLVAYADITR